MIADRFRLVRQLGRGGMGEVWAAQHASLDIPCAVKFIHAESAAQPEVRARFEREAKAAAQLRSANVVHILDYGVFEDTPYIAMEYLDGEPLSARLKRRGRLDPQETFRVVVGVAKALTKAHAASIVHRDLKPENVFLVADDEGEIPKVLDFGVAKRTTSLDSNTRTGALLGTPYYMSPEQAQGTKTIDHRADLWSLAVLTYRCITGELPFKSSALGDLLIKIVTHPIPVPSQVAPGIPDRFDEWWARASQRDPSRRFQSAKELADALKLALGLSMPSVLDLTPMPDGGRGSTVPGGGFQPGQVVTMGPQGLGGAPLPFAGPPFAGPPPARQALASGGMLGSGAHAMPNLGDSGAGASVAGLAAPPKTGSGAKLAAAGALLALLGAAMVVGLVLLRGPAGSDAPDPAAAESESVAGASATLVPAASAVPPEPSVEPAQSNAAGGAGAVAPTASAEVPPPKAVTARRPRRPTKPVASESTGSKSTGPSPLPTRLDVPHTPPPAKTYDPGF